MEYSRERPSARYGELLKLNEEMHLRGAEKIHILPPEKTFTGSSLKKQVVDIKMLIEKTRATSLLDYGCGKGILYQEKEIVIGETHYDSLKNYWGIEQITLYDPAYAPYRALPAGQYDGVICTDVLEHCPQEDLPWIIEELFTYARAFVFGNVAAYPALKFLSDGQNAHATVQPYSWWKTLVEQGAQKFPEIQYKFIITERHLRENGQKKEVLKIIQKLKPTNPA